MKIDIILSVVVGAVLIAFVIVDRLIVVSFKPTFEKLEHQRIIISNKLASAKIVYENLNHVRDLVQKNMIFPGQVDTVTHESIFFDFITTCVNDLKMKLVSCKPTPPVVTGVITTYGYELELEGDFFSFGELCSKFENSRRLTTLNSFQVNLRSADFNQSEETYFRKPSAGSNKDIVIKMNVNTYRIKKVTAS
ncbi:MAG: hypothetical protein JXA71_04440 [Chitinispirillaceae bacterium]|nr:hypothetical protein [Chitinispirillaceae bacterium]